MYNVWNAILGWFSNLAQRDKLIREFNKAAKESFVLGLVPTLLKSKKSKGYSLYKHKYSNWLCSGFRVEAFAGRVLSKNEVISIAEVVLADDALVRNLVVLGFDTLEVHGEEANFGCRWQLKDYMLLKS